jgi:deoxyadenosine/deoxycytidine kinase
MIIWINGAFGAGKTQTAFELHRRIPASFVYDPENAGYFIRKNSPKETHISDFQNEKMWREFNYAMLKHIHSKYKGVVIAPMTLSNRTYYNEIVGRLKAEDIRLQHFLLSASRETLLRRLKSRGESADSWAAQQMESCLKGFEDDIFDYRVDTENKTVEEVAEAIACQCGILLLPQSRGPVKKLWNRIKTKIQHMRV